MYYKISMNPQGKYYPKSITKGKVISTKKIAEKLAQISTVSEADARAVLSMLGEVMADYLASGRSVKLDGPHGLPLGKRKAGQQAGNIRKKDLDRGTHATICRSQKKVWNGLTLDIRPTKKEIKNPRDRLVECVYEHS